MKKILTLSALGLLTLAVGCSDKKGANTAKNETLQPAPAAPKYPENTGGYIPPAGDNHAAGPVNPNPDNTSAAAPAGGGKKYVVKKGDTLWSIAQRTYGDGKQYKKITAANPTAIKNDQVFAGTTIILP